MPLLDRMRELDRKHRVVERAIKFYRWWTTYEDPRTTEGFLKLLDYICNRVGGVAVIAIVWDKVQTYRTSDVHSVAEISLRLVLPCLLLLLLGVVYAFSRHSVRVELAIGRKLFPRGRVPDKWGGPRTRVGIAVSVVVFLALYLLLAYLSSNIILSASIMFTIACIDFNTRRLIGKGITEVFADPRYAPGPDDKDREVIETRRSVARWFLFKLPHLQKEAARVVGCGLAFGLALLGYLYASDWLTASAYLMLIGTLIANEIVTFLWRRDRDRQFDAIDE